MADFGTLFSTNGSEKKTPKPQKRGNDRITYLHYAKLTENAHQYRKFNPQEIEEMADLIAAAGKVLQPLLVRKIDADEYEIIAGHKRRAGAKFLAEERRLEKYAFLPCIVSNADDIKARFAVVGTNVRPPQTPFEVLHEIEEMRELLTLYPEAFPDMQGGRMVERLAEQLHMARSTVSEYRKIANNLGKAGMEAMEKGVLDKSAALELSSLPDDEQEQLIRDGILTYKAIKDYRKKKKETAASGEAQALRKPDPDAHPYERHGCITGWSRYPDICSCCGHGGAECCRQCDSDTCNSRCGWVDDPYVPEHEPESPPEETRGNPGTQELTADTGADGHPVTAEDAQPETSIDELDLPIHTYTTLKRAGIDTARQLKEMTHEQLAAVRKIGKRDIEIIENALKDFSETEEPVEQEECATPHKEEQAGKDATWFVEEYFKRYGRGHLPELMRICRENKNNGDRAKAAQKLIAPYGYSGGGSSDFDCTFRGFSKGIDFSADNFTVETHMAYGEFVVEMLKLYDPWSSEWMPKEGKTSEASVPTQTLEQPEAAETVPGEVEGSAPEPSAKQLAINRAMQSQARQCLSNLSVEVSAMAWKAALATAKHMQHYLEKILEPEAGGAVAEKPCFTALFLRDILQDKEHELQQMEECNAQPDGKLPERMMQEHRAVVQGLRMLLDYTEKMEGEGKGL